MILGVLQARATSSRLPGKVLKPILGRPMLARQIERLQRSTRIERLLVATSVDPSDDAVQQAAEEAGAAVARGSLNDVLDRF
ncbi:MAG TPA: spore coat protein, partial [Candidatus Binatia bacterium]|nr:spore coat protein [Candidatus Binatia bacterium]